MGRLGVRGVGVAGQGRAGQGSVHLAYLEETSLALKLLTSISHICAGAIVRGVLHRGAVAVLLGDRWVGELLVHNLDCRIKLLGSTLLAFFPRDKGISLLGLVIEIGLDVVCCRASVPVMVCYSDKKTLRWLWDQ